MRRLLALTALAGLISSPAFASNLTKFSENMTLPADASVNIEIGFSEDMQQRAIGMPEKLSDRSSARGLRDGFAANGFIGERELVILSDDLRDELETDFSRAGISVSPDASYTLRVTVVNAKPNRPTLEQLSVQPSLSFNSFGEGGAKVQAELIGPNGDVVGASEYGWYDSPIDYRFSQAQATWGDAKRVFSRFAKRTAKTITN